jgi:hypothetical protein
MQNPLTKIQLTKIGKRKSSVLPILALLSLAASSAQGLTLVNDKFTDAVRVGSDNAWTGVDRDGGTSVDYVMATNNSTPQGNNNAPNVSTSGINEKSLSVTNRGSAYSISTYFPLTTIAPGESISVSFNVRTSGFTPTAVDTAFRFGLFDSNVERLTANSNFSGGSGTNVGTAFQDDRGYAAFYDTTTGINTGTHEIRERISAGTTTTSNITSPAQYSPASGGVTTGNVFATNTTYPVTLNIARSSDGLSLTITTSFNGINLTFTDTDVLVTEFDHLAILFANQFGNSSTPGTQLIDDVLVLHNPATPVAAPLLAYFPFNSNFNDASGNNNHLSSSSGTPNITATTGQFTVGGGALNLDQSGTQEHLSLTTPINFNGTTPWSMSWWGKRSISSADTHGIVAGKITNTGDLVFTPNIPSGLQGIRLRNSTADSTDFSGIADDNAYHHWAVVYNGLGNVEVWRDNINQGSKAFSGVISLTHVGAGNPNQTNSFFGQIDDLSIYNGAIDATKVNELFSVGVLPAITRLRIYLLGGQSNADGRATTSGFPTTPVNLQQPQNDVSLFYKVEGGNATLTTLRPALSETNQSGPETTLGRRMADAWAFEPDTRVAIIKYANGATNLYDQWKAGGNATTTGDGLEYVTFQQTVTQGLAALSAAYPNATLDLQGMVWMQGEADVSQNQGAAYETNLTTFITDVRATYGADLPFIVGRLSSSQTALVDTPEKTTQYNLVRNAQTAVAAALPRVSLIDTDGFGINSDNLHFSAAGQQSLGYAAANSVFAYVPFSSQPTTQWLSNGDIQVTLANAHPGWLYTLQISGTIQSNEWSNGDAETSTGTTVVLIYTPGPSETKRFFRVTRNPAP